MNHPNTRTRGTADNHDARSFEQMAYDALKTEILTAERSRARAKGTPCAVCAKPQGYRGAVLIGYRNVALCGEHIHRYWKGQDLDFNEDIDRRLNQ